MKQNGGSWEAYSDGASRGNPGHAAIGAVLLQDGETVLEISEYIGEATNNVAEYRALVRALQAARERQVEQLTVYTDSQLIARQLNGVYRVKSASLKPLYQEAKQSMEQFSEIEIVHVPREQNQEADRLANQALDALI